VRLVDLGRRRRRFALAVTSDRFRLSISMTRRDERM
jgi:hypothetical protein